MSSGTIQVVANIGGVKETMNIVRSAAATITVESTLEAGKAGTLSTRTGVTEGTLTLGANHGITDGEVIRIDAAVRMREPQASGPSYPAGH